MPLLRHAFSIILACAACLAPKAGYAAFLFCNETKSVIEAAFGQRDEGAWVSQGWWQIQPGQCARVYSKPLTQRFYFYYARALTLGGKDGKGPTLWSGKYSFCIDTKAFRIEGDGNCEARGFKAQGFQDVDVGLRQKTYTLTFQDVNE